MKKNADFKNCAFFEGTDAAFEMIAVQGGTFKMGSNDYDNEKPIHSVKLGDFWMGKHLVTQAVWKKVMAAENPSYFKGDDRPVEQVSWNDIVQTFLPKLNGMTQETRPKDTKFCLPTEAQWEYAARGGVHKAKHPFFYSGGDKLEDVAWYDGNSHQETKPVGLKLPNLLDLYDMSGNVWEWCSDLYNLYAHKAAMDLLNLHIDVNTNSYRVLRGGRGGNFSQHGNSVYDRYVITFMNRYHNVGFRLCLFSTLSV